MAKRNPYPSNPEVRAWADARFEGIPSRGPIPGWAIDEWNRTHPKRKYVADKAYHGTTGGYTYHGCREECCTAAWNAYHADYRALAAA